MTDARFPERWLNDRRLMRLPDPAFRLFVVTLAWSVANKTDGVIEDDDLALIPGIDQSASAQLESSGLWERNGSQVLIAEFEDTQTTSDQLAHLANQRRQARDRKRRERARRASAVTRDIPRDVTADVTPDSTRTGQALRAAPSTRPNTGSPSSRHAGGAGVPAGGPTATPPPFPTPGNDDGPKEQLPPEERNSMNGVQRQTSATAPIARARKRR